MKNIINRIKNDKVLFFLSILIIGVFLVLVIRITYSYLAAFINEARENVTIGSDTTDKLEFFEGNPIDLNVTSTTLPEGGGNYAQSTTYRAEFTANSTNNTAEDSYYVYFNVTANTLGYIQEGNPEVILTVFQDDTEITNIEGLTYGTYNGVNGFDVTTATGMFTVASDYAITSNSSTDATVQNWTFTLTYLNQNYDQSGNYGNNMSVEFIMSKEEKIVTFADTCRQTNSNTLACHVATQYTIDGANGLYYHDADLANGAGDNSYRYAGANPNNYVCFGSTENPCPEENLYRIIGVFDNEVKLIKSDYTTSNQTGTDGDYVGTYPYDLSSYIGNLGSSSISSYYWNGSANNTWSESPLNTVNLKTNFLNSIGSTWSNLIATHSWKVGGMAYSDTNTAKQYYDTEIGSSSSSTTYSAKIGLMYVSDYGFAASPDYWTTELYNYEPSKSSNWMYMGLYEWTISRSSGTLAYAFFIHWEGRIGSEGVGSGSGISYAVRPCFYLNSNVQYASGSGTATDPIRIN